jgi:hypothetical protein
MSKARKLIVVHGWSDSGSGFFHLIETLKKQTDLEQEIIDINLTDYISMSDEVTYDDLVDQFQILWSKKGLSTSAFSVDAIVHSTGALLIRAWLTRYYTPENAPIKRLLMLAPANFGSYLASMGQSVFGRIGSIFRGGTLTEAEKERRKYINITLKGKETGKFILRGLEMASPYTWNLAKKDVLTENSYYGKNKILTSILVGNTGWSGLSRVANKDGSDGTVYMSTANLNCAKLDLDLTQYADYSDEHPVTFELPEVQLPKNAKIAYAVMNNENHSTVAGKDWDNKQQISNFHNKRTLDFIKKSLQVTDETFDQHYTDLHKHTYEKVMPNQQSRPDKQGYQNTVFLVTDQYGHRIKDYNISMQVVDQPVMLMGAMNLAKAQVYDHLEEANRYFHREVFCSVAHYTQDKAYRSIMINCTRLHALMDEFTECALEFSILAEPDLEHFGYYAGYQNKKIPTLFISREKIKEIFVENRTLLIHVTFKREQNEDILTIEPYEEYRPKNASKWKIK